MGYILKPGEAAPFEKGRPRTTSSKQWFKPATDQRAK
jgi:hypothetical protein